MDRILLVKPKHLGDMLLLVPSVLALRSQITGVRVDILGNEKSIRILEPFREINQIWTIQGDANCQRLTEDISRIRYDCVIEMHGQPFTMGFVQNNSFGGAKRFLSNSIAARDDWKNAHASRRDWIVISELMGLSEEPLLRPLYPAPNMKLKTLGLPDLKRFAIFQTLSNDPHRTWFVENWRELASGLMSRFDLDGIVLPFGSESEHTRVKQISRGIKRCFVPPKALGFKEHAALARRSTVCVSVNTGTMHLAAAVNAKIVAIWGPESYPMKVWNPLCDNFLIVREDEIVRPSDIRGARLQGGMVDNNSVSTVASAVSELMR